MQDPYTVLGISKTASDDEVKKAYRKLAHQHHPDKKGGNAGKFKEINEAYQILSDPAKRRQFDQFGFANDGAYGGQGNPFGGYSGGSFDFSDIFDVFGSAFGGGFGDRPEPSKGEDIYVEVPVTKKDLGATRVFEFQAHNPCDVCTTTGVAPGAKLKDCDVCRGAGQIRQSVRTPFGTFTQAGICPQCLGKRQIPEKKCTSCKGTGRVEATRKIEIHIPRDIPHGYSIVFPRQGSAGLNGKPAGDLLITLKLK